MKLGQESELLTVLTLPEITPDSMPLLHAAPGVCSLRLRQGIER